jgi:ubiquinone/menaquinone biosynthesis C-methylase UbiE
MSSGFDRLAPYYDSLARLVFGKSIRRCQTMYLHKIPAAASVLILGGGTGWLLEELLKINHGCEVWYVESSEKMIERARARVRSASTRTIHFVHGTEKNLRHLSEVQFDAVITNFYFDLFDEEGLNVALFDVENRIQAGAVLLVSEFVDRKWWMRLLLFLMYAFFRLVGAMKTKSLPDWQKQLLRMGFVKTYSSSFYFGFIQSCVYVFEKDDGKSSRH